MNKLQRFILEAHREHPERIKSYPGKPEVKFWLCRLIKEIRGLADTLQENYITDDTGIPLGPEQALIIAFNETVKDFEIDDVLEKEKRTSA